MLRARLAYAYQCSPVALRELTLEEAAAMEAVLTEVEEVIQRGR
jgi:hypothetical protein